MIIFVAMRIAIAVAVPFTTPTARLRTGPPGLLLTGHKTYWGIKSDFGEQTVP